MLNISYIQITSFHIYVMSMSVMNVMNVAMLVVVDSPTI